MLTISGRVVVLLSMKCKSSNLGKQPGVSIAFGKFSQLYKPSFLRFFKLEMLLGRYLWFLQHTHNVRRLVRYSIDEGSANLSVPCSISRNFLRISQPLRQNCLRDFSFRPLGIILRFLHLLRH